MIKSTYSAGRHIVNVFPSLDLTGKVFVGATSYREGWVGDVDLWITADDAREIAANLIAVANEVDGIEAPVTVASTKPQPKGYTALTPLARTVYRHMDRAGSISAREAMADHGITSASLARRICDIEAAGFGVKRERKVHPLTQQSYTRDSLAA